MAARATWKGQLRIEDACIPVKFYSGVESRGVHFRLLHAADQQPVSQRMVDPESGDEVPREAIRKGFEVEEDVFVVLDPKELAEAEPPASRDIDVTAFVETQRIANPWYDRPYYLGPDGDEEGYFALAQALGGQGVAGLAHWVMRKKSYAGALQVHEGRLMMMTLHHAEEVVALPSLRASAPLQPDPRELKLAEQLVAALAAPFEPDAYADEYRKRVEALIEAKAKGRALPAAKRPRKAPQKSLADALRASVKSAKEKRIA